ncbi:MAG: methyltransferase domain-containing protein [Magnetococcales bacterium]|nr:methyltransferase domain-containing protein [Magnetococcales bacterium]
MDENVVSFVKPLDQLSSHRVRQAWQKCGDDLVDPSSLVTQVGKQLITRLEEIKIEPKQVLNFGERGGLLTADLRRKLPKTNIVAATMAQAAAIHAAPYHGFFSRRRQPAVVTGDRALPFKRNSFDVVLSNMALHWCNNPKATLREIRRVLKPGGAFLMSMAGGESLQELKVCLADLDRQRWGKAWPRIPELPDMHTFGDLLASCGFSQTIVDRDPIQAPFPDLDTVLKGLKKMGAGNYHRDRLSGLTTKKYFKELAELYQQRFALPDGRINVSMEVLFGHAWKADPSRIEEQQSQSCALPKPTLDPSL